MNAPADIHDLVSRLKAHGSAFALATVVRTVSVTSAKAGAKAVIQPDGTITEGWIGGGCARAAVLRAAKEAIADGAPRLVSIQPEDLLDEHGVQPGDEVNGVRFARNMCPSQGTMDIFVEPIIPRPELVIFGASPVAVALAALAKPLGFSRTICASVEDIDLFSDFEKRVDGFEINPASAASRYLVVATQGKGDERALCEAVKAESDYVGFVGSRKKIAALQDKLRANGVDEAQVRRVQGPAGLDIKAISPEEIALSIVAELILVRRTGHLSHVVGISKNVKGVRQ